MASFLRVLRWSLASIVVVLLVAFLQFYLPWKDVVRIVGTDVKRMDVISRQFVEEGEGTQYQRTRDVRFINTLFPDGKPRVYRNEETGWGFPWYLKFDSSNLQAEAQNLISIAQEPEWVVVTYYGWRIEILAMFPNAVSVAPASGPDALEISLFSWAVFLLFGVLLLLLWRVYLNFRRRHVDPLVESIEKEADSAVAEAGVAANQVRRGASGLYDRWQDWLDTWRPKSKRRNRRKP